MPKKKETILQDCLALFNQQGCQQISFRQLASELSMSHGNLAYHFKTKELIIEALLGQFFDAIEAEIRRSHTIDWEFEEILFLVDRLTQVFQRNAFVMKDLYFLRNMEYAQSRAVAEPKLGLGHTKLMVLLKKGYLREERFPKEYELVAKRIEWLSNYLFLGEHSLDKQISDLRITENFITYVYPMYEPYLTLEGRQKYRNGLKKYEQSKQE